MWPSIRDGFVRFFTDKDYFSAKWDRLVNKVRAAIFVFGAVLTVPGGYGETLKATFPDKARYVTIVGVLLMGASLWLRAGDLTPPEVREMAKSMTPVEVPKVEGQ